MSSSSSYPSRVELGRRQHHQNPHEVWRARVILGFAFFALLGVFLYLFAEDLSPETWGWQSFRGALLAKWSEKPFEVLVDVLVPFTLFAVMLGFAASRNDRLILGGKGIDYRRGAWRLFPFLEPSWSCAWNDIEEVEVKWSDRYAKSIELKLHLRQGRTRSLSLLEWVNVKRPPPMRSWKEMLLQPAATNEADAVDKAEKDTLVMYLRDAGVSVSFESLLKKASDRFDLATNRYSAGTLIGLAVLGSVGFYSYIVMDESFPTGARVLWLFYAAAGVASMLITKIILTRARVPFAESLVLAMLSGVVVTMSLYPATLYLNAWTDSEGMKPYTYIVRPGRGLEPTVKTLPWIRDGLHRDFYLSYVGGEQYTVWLRKGGLRIWQFDSERINKALRAGESVRRHENGQGKTK